QHLRLYDSHRICQCGACRSAHSLTLKFVAHRGDLVVTQVKDHAKLFGKAVIAAHRLLKNDIPHHEYALLTDTVDEVAAGAPVPWAPLEKGTATYDVGTLAFDYLPLTALLTEVTDVPLPSPVFRGRALKVQEWEAEYDHPVEEVFQAVIELPARTSWME